MLPLGTIVAGRIASNMMGGGGDGGYIGLDSTKPQQYDNYGNPIYSIPAIDPNKKTPVFEPEFAPQNASMSVEQAQNITDIQKRLEAAREAAKKKQGIDYKQMGSDLLSSAKSNSPLLTDFGKYTGWF